jgi:hypothetical protein
LFWFKTQLRLKAGRAGNDGYKVKARSSAGKAQLFPRPACAWLATDCKPLAFRRKKISFFFDGGRYLRFLASQVAPLRFLTSLKISGLHFNCLLKSPKCGQIL